MATKILLADDNELMRIAIRFLLRARADWEIVHEAVDGVDAVEKARIGCPDIAILDIEMPGMNGIQAAAEIIKYCPHTVVLTNSVHDVRLLMTQLKQAGIKAFVSKNSLAADLIPTIEHVLRGGTSFDQKRAGTGRT